jgi:hypothetical protein
MLNNPGDELVLSDGFLGMVERLDSCLTYLKTHVSGDSRFACFCPMADTLTIFTERLQGCRDLFDPIPAMHDQEHDPDQALCRQRSTFTGTRGSKTYHRYEGT